MKNILSICLILIINLSFAQESSFTIFNSITNENKEAFSLTKNEDAKFLQFKEIVSVHFEKATTIPEGKFSLKDLKDKSITSLLSELDKNTKNKFLNVEKISSSGKNTIAKKSIMISTNQKFIHRIITAKIKQESLTNKSISLANNNWDTFNNFPEMLDQLRINYALAENLELQIGDNIYSFINKSFKSELENTLCNSLNLLALNL